MTDQCPTTGYTCVDTMRAQVQACIDQLKGFLFFVESQTGNAKAEHLIKHYAKLGELLQETLDGYSADHGQIPMQADLEATAWVLNSLQA